MLRLFSFPSFGLVFVQRWFSTMKFLLKLTPMVRFVTIGVNAFSEFRLTCFWLRDTILFNIIP